MFTPTVFSERKSPPAAAFPPSAAEPAAGIASAHRGLVPTEALLVPAASFFEASIGDPDAGVRQWRIEPRQCRWILADEDAGAEALMCGALTEPRRPFCADHCLRVYMPRVAEEGEEGVESAAAEPRKDEKNTEQQEAR